MHLTDQDLSNPSVWQKAGIRLPEYDRAAMIRQTKQTPAWVHFGAGNIFRAFPASLQQKLLEQGKAHTGIIVAEGYDYEIVERAYRPHDNLSLLVTLKADGSIGKTVIGSIAESLKADSADKTDFPRLREIFRAPGLQMASFTITEKGYSLTRGDGGTAPDVERDFAQGPAKPKSYMGKIVSLVYERYAHGASPLALVSLDNCSHNGTKLRNAVLAFAEQWVKNGLTDSGFLRYLKDPAKISFPWSMIDKITPRPDAGVKAMLEQAGFEDTGILVTHKNTYVAPFVNSEQAQYLVIEDHFPNGRPPLDQAGAIFTDRGTVDKVEKMKVCTCLNPLHTALAVFGCLLGYKKISDEMKDADLVRLVKGIGYREGLPVVVDPGILSPKAFLDEVLQVRIPNPFMPDTPQRIATDTSQKLPIRFGETIKAYLADGSLQIGRLKLIPLVLAGWCRYLLGIDDGGTAFPVSPDPMYPTLKKQLGDLRPGDAGPFHKVLQPILSNSAIFAVDLYQAGLGETVEKDFAELMAGKGAVRATLRRHLAES
ncbi:MAG: mannitol dehydrogenase family protein [Oscillospiraceae bacterium]|jgi:fructuronate reductase|nr:mannitol dehydrogenase family protein [Oscillospiraceae bacterium]MCI1990194.1 mannitol dehydrogenase family protein [Oscillospiraceae bacterium]MCI2035129.1 mannitol dehydrogenase family protein [Oscillospiraceae bacterium]